MITLIYETSKYEYPRVIWRIGDGPVKFIDGIVAVEITNNTDAKTYIFTRFPNLPRRIDKSKITYYGDLAKFIAGNLEDD